MNILRGVEGDDPVSCAETRLPPGFRTSPATNRSRSRIVQVASSQVVGSVSEYTTFENRTCSMIGVYRGGGKDVRL